jgi:hypothetical protein
MPSLVTSLLRPLLWSSILIVIVAVGLGRRAPRPLPERRPADPRYHGVIGRFSRENDTVSRYFDRQTGQLMRIDIPGGDTFECGSCSPWRDDRGQYQMACRWLSRTDRGNRGLPQEFGIARIALPEGRVIDRFALEHIPIGEPCWVPGLTPHILYSAGDGQIYSYTFPDSNEYLGADVEAGERPQSEAVTWKATPPGLGVVYFKDLIWPSDPRLKGRLLVSLSYQDCINGKKCFVGPQLWWIALNDDSTEIEAAGRLDDPLRAQPADPMGDEERLPNLATTPSGDPVLAYLSRPRGEPLWDLRVASLTTDPVTGAPRIGPGGNRALTRHCVASIPVFSADFRWVYGIVGRDSGFSPLAAQRFSVPDALMLASPAGPRPDDPDQPGRLDREDLAGFFASRLVDGRSRHHARH